MSRYPEYYSKSFSENKQIRKIKNELKHGNIFNFRCKGVITEIIKLDDNKYKAKIKVGESIYEIPINQNITLPNICYEMMENRGYDINPTLAIDDIVELSVFKIIKRKNRKNKE